MYIEGSPPLYISYAGPEQTIQDQYQETIEAAGDKGQRIKKVTKIKVSNAWKEIGLSTVTQFELIMFNLM